MGARISGSWGTGAGTPTLEVTGDGARHAGDRLEVVIDGVIFNRAELGSEPDDAALVAWLYRRHGMRGCLDRLIGDFAIAVLDTAEDVLWLARDRFGLQPLYYTRVGQGVAFASQPGPLLGLPGVSRRPNSRFVALFAGSHYRTFDNDPHRSPYEDIAQLPGAHLLRAGATGVHIAPYWSIEPREDLPGDEAELADEYRSLLEDAVRLRLGRFDRPAFTLSGGMDSSSVIATAVKVSGAHHDAFSTVYKDPTFDESADIAPMLGAVVGQWHPVSVDDPDVFGLVQRMIRAHDEPVATATWLSHFQLCEHVAAQGYDVLFGGLGGDELNAGEYEYFPFHFADLRTAGDEEQLQHELEAWVRHHDHPVHRKSREVAEAHLRRLVDLSEPGRCLPDMDRMLRYADALGPAAWDITQFRPEMDMPFTSYLRNRTYQDMVRETAPCCLRAEDRHVTAFGLRRSDPFFDHRLAEFMFRVPGAMKIRDGVTKRLLREAMKGTLPDETRLRVKKTGWNAPAHQWFTGGGADAIRDLVGSAAFRDRGIYDVDVVLRLLDEHEQIVSSGVARENHMMFFWQLVNLELWLRDLDTAV
jgi:asparagine synthase (glutamine-hydrolysing)